MEEIILIGGGGHCKSVIDTIKRNNKYRIIGVLDLEEKLGEEILGIKIIDRDDRLEYYFKNGVKSAFLTIGSIGDTSLRRRLFLYALSIGYKFPNIIDRSAVVSKYIKLGQGNFVGKAAVINAGSIIDDNCIINTGAIIEHDCRLGNFSHIAPGVSLSGGVIIGENTHIGTNSTVIQNIKIGENTIVGAGSTIIRDIKSNVKAYGNPAREVKR